jgi:hypothetical protein
MKKGVLICLLFIANFGFSQSKFHVFLGPGLAYYQGDVSETGLPYPAMLKFNGKIGVGYDFTPKWGLRLHGSMGTLHGSDSYTTDLGKQARGIAFSTSIIDAGLTFKWNNVFKKQKLINYLFIGADYLNMNVTRTVSSPLPLAAESAFSNHQMTFPIGGGLGFRLSNYIALVFESSYHFSLTDYMDGTKYSANPKLPDSYIDYHILLVFKFGSGSNTKKEKIGDCPSF